MKIEKPHRISRSYCQTLNSPPETVFPLYCPVREADWVSGWDPIVVFTDSGRVEQDCVFVTESELDQPVWLVTLHDWETYQVEMWKITPRVTASKISIRLQPTDDLKTKAYITYAHTSLGPRGDDFLNTFTAEFYELFMQKWEGAMNHYLETGALLTE